MHGEQCGMGTILMARYHELYNPDNWWNTETKPNYRWSGIREKLDEIDAPTTLKQIGVSEELAVDALVNAWKLRPERYTILHKYPLQPNVARSLVPEEGVELIRQWIAEMQGT